MKRKRSQLATVERDTNLPVLQHARDILNALSANDVLIIQSDTGSGKTTQVPQIILDAMPSAKIVITQPRRVAAITVAMRVASERNVHLGHEVGYAVRFDDRSRRGSTRIRYVTDGVLLREAVSDGTHALKSRYSHIIIDEVHERSVNTDILLALIKQAFSKSLQTSPAHQSTARPLSSVIRSELPCKLIIMSATTDEKRLMHFFQSNTSLRVANLRVKGQTYKIEIMYTHEPVQDYVEGVAKAANEVNTTTALPGDILVFLPGQEEIAAAASIFKRITKQNARRRKHTRICELYASQPPEDQWRALQPIPDEYASTDRKVIFSTNVAETSITIPGIKYVIDSGVVKVRTNITHKGVTADVIKTQPVSVAEADQRKGRAGRINDGVVFRLFTEPEKDKLKCFPDPEILRAEASSTLLQIFALKHRTNAIMKKNARRDTDQLQQPHALLQMMDKIPDSAKARGIEILLALQALNDDMSLTRIGELMARIPTTPMLARCLLESVRLGCPDSVLSLVAVLSIEGDIFVKPRTKMEEARTAHRRFISPLGDHLTIINAFNSFSEVFGEQEQVEFCRDHFLNQRVLASAGTVRSQLTKILNHGDVISWSLKNPLPSESIVDVQEAGMDNLVRRCIVAGFFSHIARKRPDDGKYVPLSSGSLAPSRDSIVDIHPTSSLHTERRYPELVIYNELVLTSKMYMRNVVSIDPHWLQAHSRGYLQVTFA